MKKSSMAVVCGTILSTAVILGFYSCRQPVKSDAPAFAGDSLSAHFDYFTYRGDDDFYRQNPLPGDDYYYNPILPGWYSDPSVATNGKDFFLVTSTFSYFPGVPLFHSTDLLNWKQVGHVLSRPGQLPLDGQRVSEGIFAPSISYNPHNQTWYMITTNIRRGNFYVTTKDPFGEWSDPVWLPEVGGIDPSFFFDDDGKAYIVNNDVPDGGSTYDGHRAIRLIGFDTETGKTIGSSTMLVNGGVDLSEKPIWIEGPHVYKIRGNYFLMCAEGGTSVNHREVIFKADSPAGKYQPWYNNPILTQKHLAPKRPLPVTCAGHADLVQKDNGQWWAVFLACRPIDNQFENLGRETFLLPVRWSEDGFPYMTKGDEVIAPIVQMEGVKRDSTATFGNFERSDSFDAVQLGMTWMTLRGPATDRYSLSENPGFLTLRCADAASNELKTPAYVCRRLQHHQFECTTALYFDPHHDGEAAGLLLNKDEQHQYLFAFEQALGATRISLKKIKADGSDVLAAVPLTIGTGELKLKVTSNGKEFRFAYAAAGGDWTVLVAGIDASYLSTAQSFGFTGTCIGPFATRTSR